MSNITNKIIKFESGESSFDEIVELLQELADNGLHLTLQGSYGRIVKDFYNAGLISIDGKFKKDGFTCIRCGEDCDNDDNSGSDICSYCSQVTR